MLTQIANGIAINGDIQYMNWENTDYKVLGIVESGSKVEWTFWHVALFVSNELNNLTPYAGIRYSNANANVEVEDEDAPDTIDTKNNFGLIGGLSFGINQNWSGNIEFHVVDETYFSGLLKVKL